MGAIGNYVHLTAAGYNKTGINKQKQAPSIDAATALSIEKDSIRQRIESYAKTNDLSSLESEINSLLSSLGYDNGTKRDYSTKVKLIIENYLKEIYGNTLQEIDWNNLNVNYLSDKSKGVGKIKTNYWVYKDWKKTILKRIDELNYYLDNFTENKNTREYENAVRKIKEIRSEIYNGTYDLITNNGAEEPKKNSLKIAIKDLNEIIDLYAAMPAISAQKGDLLEATIAAVPTMAENLTRKELAKIIKSNITGRVRTEVSIDESKFKDKSWNVKLGDITQTGRASQNKIDVAFEWENQHLNISAKNVNLDKKGKFIRTVSGSSLLYLIQDENSDFVNHYFSLFANHTDKKGNTSGYTAQRRSYYDVLKLIIAYKALTGDTFGRGNDKAEVFIVNDSSGSHNPKIKVFSVSDILKKFLDYPSSNLGIQNSSEIQKLYSNKKVLNSPSGAARIASVLNEAHQRKINASFNSEILDW